MTAIITGESHLMEQIRRGIQAALDAEIEKYANEAAERARKAVRERLGAAAVSTLAEYDIHRRGSNLVITVRADLDGVK